MIWASLVQKFQSPEDIQESIRGLRREILDSKEKELEGQKNLIEQEIHKLRHDRNRLADRTLENEGRGLSRSCEQEMDKIHGKIKNLEVSRDRLQDRINVIVNSLSALEEAEGLVSDIQERRTNLEKLRFKKRREIVERLYPTENIRFFPRWWLESCQEAAQRLESVLASLKESAFETERGVVICMGWVDYDCHRNKKLYDFDQLGPFAVSLDFPR
ncbi:hypothetical protein GTO27_07115 [Candidatus Bathyarchaeota archaeon]|nr:hypothetical protein [Candidatus Bathyarchaeota archaeon]